MEWEALWERCAAEVADTDSCRLRFREHLLAQLVCPGRHTITSLLTTNGHQFEDWSAHYDLYAKERIHNQVLFDQVRTQIDQIRDCTKPLVVALDDTILRKTGKTIPFTAYRKDPLSPPFHLNLVWAQRMIQLSAAVPGPQGQVRMIPIGFEDASTPRKPRKNASPEQWDTYRELMRQANLNRRAIDALHRLQNIRSQPQGIDLPLHLLVDGSFTNRKVLRNLPAQTTLIGRIRKDAHLCFVPQAQPAHGRKRIYGERAPTPEQLRQDTSQPWQRVRVYFAGKLRTLRLKTLAPLRWSAAGAMDLRVVVIAPHPYRKRIGARRLYRQPAFLICTDTDMALKTIVQHYIWRWDIELNHRDEKTLLGVGQAQVRNEHSVTSVPAAAVAAYAMLHVAAIRAFGWNAMAQNLPLPKWRNPNKKKRASTLDLINELRRELWASSIREGHLTRFVKPTCPEHKPPKQNPSLPDMLFYATN